VVRGDDFAALRCIFSQNSVRDFFLHARISGLLAAAPMPAAAVDAAVPALPPLAFLAFEDARFGR
jgi:hypothetical protein